MPRKFSELTNINMSGDNNEYNENTYVVGYYVNSNRTKDNSKINVTQFARTSDLDNTNTRVTNLETGCLYKNKEQEQTVVGEVIFNDVITFGNNSTINVNGTIKNKDDDLSFKSNLLDISSNVDNTMDFYWKDKNGVNCAIDTLGTTASGSIYRNIRVKAHNSNTYEAIGLECDANDNFYTYAPTPSSMTDDSTKIVTTEWINDKFQFVNELPNNPAPGVFYFVKE